MAHEEEVQSELSSSMSFDELYEIFHDLFVDYKKINERRKELKSKN